MSCGGIGMSEKRFTNIEHDYENAWIKCNDDGDFMIYAIYKELDESLPSLENLLNGLSDENKKLQRELEECKNNKLFSRRELERENNELKEEVQLLKEGMETYENSIPYVCTCGQVRDINSEMFEFRMKQNKFYKEHPNRCTVVIDGVRYE